MYVGTELFNKTQCTNLTTSTGNEIVRGEVVTPIISIVEDDTSENEVILTYSRASYGSTVGDMYICAYWNSSINCGGGGWTTKNCNLTITPSGDYQCRCLHQGIFTLLNVIRVSSRKFGLGGKIWASE